MLTEQIWHFLEALDWYQIDFLPHRPWNVVPWRVFVMPVGTFIALTYSRTALQGLILLGRLSILGLLGGGCGSVQDSIMMPPRLLIKSLLEFTSDDCKWIREAAIMQGDFLWGKTVCQHSKGLNQMHNRQQSLTAYSVFHYIYYALISRSAVFIAECSWRIGCCFLCVSTEMLLPGSW